MTTPESPPGEPDSPVVSPLYYIDPTSYVIDALRARMSKAAIVHELIMFWAFSPGWPEPDKCEAFVTAIMSNLQTESASRPGRSGGIRGAIGGLFTRRQRQQEPQVAATPVPFPYDIAEIQTLKYHGLRALCGALMDRHSECLSHHPFCGPQDPVIQLIAHVVQQWNPDLQEPVLGIYLCTAEGDGKFSNANPASTEEELLEHILGLTYAGPVPTRKMVVSLLSDGTYVAQYGLVENPVEHNYWSGRADPDSVRTLYCDPEPSHARYLYHDNDISEGQDTIPEYHCLQANGTWWVVDVDRTRGIGAIVAGLESVDNPSHNQSIHQPETG